MLRSCPSRLLLPLALILTTLVAPEEIAAADGMTLPGLDGGQLSIADLGKGLVIVVVWASWSPSCRDIVIRANALERRWSKKARLVTVVFQEDAAQVREFLAGKNLEAPVYLDTTGSFSKKYAVATLPGLLVFKDGATSFSGKLPVNPDLVIERTLG